MILPDEELMFVTDESCSDMRIDTYLAKLLDGYSRSHIQKMIAAGAVRIDSETVKPSYRISEGEHVYIALPEPVKPDIEPENIPIDIVYEDDDVLVVNKPKGMVVHPAPGHYSGTLVNALMYHCGGRLSSINGVLRPGIVHRIDKDTSGLLIVCKNDMSHNCIAEQLNAHSITRRYKALVYNNFTEDSGTVDAPIGRHPSDRKKMSVNYRNGREAVTHYSVLERFGRYTYIECRLETGRTHQIRVHMAHIGHPVVGDCVYGPERDPFHLNGQMLHAGIIGFIHPSSGEYMEFEAPLPEQFESLLNRMRNGQS